MAEATNPITTASNPRVGPLERVRHLKRGTEYEVLGEAELQIASVDMLNRPLRLSEGARLTVYRGSDGKLWARETEEFRDGRFETIASAPSHEAGAGGDLGGLSEAELKAAEKAVLAEWQAMSQKLLAEHISWPVSPTNWRILRAGWKAIAALKVGTSEPSAASAGGAKILAGLEDALAFAQGDTSRGTLLTMKYGELVEIDGDDTPKSSPSQTPVDPQMTVEEARQGVRGTEVQAFAKAVLHGDDEHRDWLTEAADAWVCGRPLPAPRGKGTTPEAALRTLQAAGEVRHG